VIVREAIQEYAARTGRLTEEERLHMLKLFDRMIARIPSRPQEEAEAEIAEIRSARRSRGRRTRLEWSISTRPYWLTYSVAKSR